MLRRKLGHVPADVEADGEAVVYGKGSLLAKMPGDPSNLPTCGSCSATCTLSRARSCFLSGREFGQWNEWNHESVLDWELLQSEAHGGVRRWVDDLNRLYRREAGPLQVRLQSAGLPVARLPRQRSERVDILAERGCLGRRHPGGLQFYAGAATNYRVGTPAADYWEEILNGDAAHYGGSGWGNLGGVEASPIPSHGQPTSLILTLPPLAVCSSKLGESLRLRIRSPIELCMANERPTLGWQLCCRPFPGAAVQLPHQRGFIDSAKLNRKRSCRSLGTFATREEAKKPECAVQFFKRRTGSSNK